MAWAGLCRILLILCGSAAAVQSPRHHPASHNHSVTRAEHVGHGVGRAVTHHHDSEIYGLYYVPVQSSVYVKHDPSFYAVGLERACRELKAAHKRVVILAPPGTKKLVEAPAAAHGGANCINNARWVPHAPAHGYNWLASAAERAKCETKFPRKPVLTLPSGLVQIWLNKLRALCGLADLARSEHEDQVNTPRAVLVDAGVSLRHTENLKVAIMSHFAAEEARPNSGRNRTGHLLAMQRYPYEMLEPVRLAIREGRLGWFGRNTSSSRCTAPYFNAAFLSLRPGASHAECARFVALFDLAARRELALCGCTDEETALARMTAAQPGLIRTVGFFTPDNMKLPDDGGPHRFQFDRSEPCNMSNLLRHQLSRYHPCRLP